jgi:hypothetical protein
MIRLLCSSWSSGPRHSNPRFGLRLRIWRSDIGRLFCGASCVAASNSQTVIAVPRPARSLVSIDPKGPHDHSSRDPCASRNPCALASGRFSQCNRAPSVVVTPQVVPHSHQNRQTFLVGLGEVREFFHGMSRFRVVANSLCRLQRIGGIACGRTNQRVRTTKPGIKGGEHQ